MTSQITWKDSTLTFNQDQIMTILDQRAHIRSQRLLAAGNSPATFRVATTGFPMKWHLRNDCRNFILLARHYPDLDSASDWSCRVENFIQPIRSTTHAVFSGYRSQQAYSRFKIIGPAGQVRLLIIARTLRYLLSLYTLRKYSQRTERLSCLNSFLWN